MQLKDDALVLDVRAQLRPSRDQVTGFELGRLRVRVSAPPVGDAANERLKVFIAKEFRLSRGRVQNTLRTVESRQARAYRAAEKNATVA